MTINGIIVYDFNEYDVHAEYEATIYSHDEIDIEYNLLGGIIESEIVKCKHPNISLNDFNDKVQDLIDKIRMCCMLDAETKYINRLVDKAEYSEER